MYVVWKKRELRGSWCEVCGATTHEARFALVPHLVASRRVDGVPRQVHIARLPSVRSCCVRDDRALQAWWRQIDRSLGALAASADRGLSEADAAAMRARLGEYVARARAGGRERQQRPAGARPPGYLAHPLRVLELGWPCRADEVKAAFRRRAKQTHPDAGGRAEDFRAVRTAYENLLEAVSGPLQ